MKTKSIILVCAAALAVLLAAMYGRTAWMLTAGLREPAAPPAPDYWPTEGWRTSTPEEQGLDSAKIAEGLMSLQEKQVNVDSLMLVRNGYVVLDAHFDPYDGTFKHDLASVTKSVMTTLIAIAADEGKIDLDRPMVEYFPGRTIANLDERKARMTVRHLTGMVNGMESGCHDGDAPTIEKMRSQDDWVQAALDRPMMAEPGTEFCYDSPGMHLLSAILQEATGMTAFDYAQEKLFRPLGIQDAMWEIDPQGYTRGWGDLHLRPEDMAKIGYLWLHRGKWDGQQIVSEAWVLDSVRAQSMFVKTDIGYGYGWWVSPGDYYAAGRGGQRVRVVASANTLVVTTGGEFEYDEIVGWLVPVLLEIEEGRPANPAGEQALAAALAAVSQSTTSWAGPIPETARQISGKTFVCASNPAGIERAQLTSGESEATLTARMNGSEVSYLIGLDGKYRLAEDGTGFRGYWPDAQTFHFEVFDIGLRERTVHIEGKQMEVDLPEMGLKVTCEEQTP